MDMASHATSEHFLSRIDRLLDWSALAPSMRAISVRVRADVPLAALKMLLLARWYGMAEPALLEACQDRISFRRFLGVAAGDSRDDARHAEAYHRNVTQAPMDTQNLVHAIEAQLLAKGYTIRAGMSAEAELVPVSSDARLQDSGVSETSFFQSGEMAKLRREGEGVVACGGGMFADVPAFASGGSPEPDAAQPVPLAVAIEWPWGATTALKEQLNIGRDNSFCPFAGELQSYRHMSRRHAELQLCDAGVWVRDLSSHNHTYVNDEEIPSGQAYLVDCDSRVRCGPNFVILLKFGR